MAVSVLKDQFLNCKHAGIKAKQMVNFYKHEEQERRKTVIQEQQNFSIRESQAQVIMHEIDELQGEKYAYSGQTESDSEWAERGG